MNTLSKITTYAIALTSLFLFACNNSAIPSSIEEREQFNISEVFASIDLREAENPDNPYDAYGKAHFQGVMYVVGKLQGSATASILDIDKYSKEFEQTLPESDALRSSSDRTLSDAEITSIYNSMKRNFSFKVTEEASPELKKEAEKFSRIFLSFQKKQDKFNFQEIKKSIVAYESEVLKNKNLKETDKAIMLKSTSTCRYSALQWEYPINNVVRNVEKNEVKVKKLKWYHWIIVVAVDAGSVLLGEKVSDAVKASTTAYENIKSELNPDDSSKKINNATTELDKTSNVG